jgi:hypothetical protein
MEADPSSLVDGSLANIGRPDAGASTADSSLPGSNSNSSSANACATVSNGVELQPVHLAFAFDVSGSMGAGDKPYHDKALKWDPVVSAARAFFAAESSAGLTASITFFPSANERLLCIASEYTKPDVAMTSLPSALFSDAITKVTPAAKGAWRAGTPTVAVMQGSSTFVETYRKTHEGRYAVVLVTDGYPERCGAADDVALVAAEAKKALAKDQQTFVIGVANPKVAGAPDTVSNLHSIAAAGGTEKAVLIDTGDPAATAAAFGKAIDQIRQAAISCSVAIPDTQSGADFDKRAVVVHYDSAGKTTELTYDKSCAGSNAWHYDNADAPTEIELCKSTCDAIRADAKAKLSVDFACEPQIVI